jgi:4-hydroxybenzoate polyprenyltransferase/phosphoserine phosphatase
MTQKADLKPLIVDLDGSLIKTDLLYETFIKAFYAKPWVILFIPFWILAGKTRLKKELAGLADLDVQCLPWNEQLIAYLREQYVLGREIVLCTGSWHTLAEKVASQFDFFSGVYGTDEATNLTGSAKASFLRDKYGDKQFAYVGNESKDLKVWAHAESAVVISDSKSLEQRAGSVCNLEKSLPTERKLSVKTILKQMRVHQWVKNALIFVPLVTSHQTTNIELLLMAALAFIAYSLCASATYILNDLADLESDRKHDKKRFRPLASGDISILQGGVLSAILLLASLLVSLQLSTWFLWSLCAYIVVTLSYSFKLKRMQTLDITVLAGLYTLRIISGAIAISLLPSFWLLAFSMFVFLCLAIIKRLSEIIKNKEKYNDETKISGRGYYITDFQVLMSLATASGMLSILVFAMYINSPEVAALYVEPYALWLVCPLFAYWIIRVLIMASRGEIDEDPIVFAIKDKRSWITGAVILLIIVLSST